MGCQLSLMASWTTSTPWHSSASGSSDKLSQSQAPPPPQLCSLSPGSAAHLLKASPGPSSVMEVSKQEKLQADSAASALHATTQKVATTTKARNILLPFAMLEGDMDDAVDTCWQIKVGAPQSSTRHATDWAMAHAPRHAGGRAASKKRGGQNAETAPPGSSGPLYYAAWCGRLCCRADRARNILHPGTKSAEVFFKVFEC